MIRNDILQKFPDLFGAKKVNGRDVNVQGAITTLTRELRPEIAAALTARRQILDVNCILDVERLVEPERALDGCLLFISERRIDVRHQGITWH